MGWLPSTVGYVNTTSPTITVMGATVANPNYQPPTQATLSDLTSAYNTSPDYLSWYWNISPEQAQKGLSALSGDQLNQLLQLSKNNPMGGNYVQNNWDQTYANTLKSIGIEPTYNAHPSGWGDFFTSMAPIAALVAPAVGGIIGATGASSGLSDLLGSNSLYTAPEATGAGAYGASLDTAAGLTGSGSTAAGTAAASPTFSTINPWGAPAPLGSGTYLPNEIGQVGTSLIDAQPATLNQMIGQATGAIDTAGAATGSLIPGINSLYDFSAGTQVPAIANASGTLQFADSLATPLADQTWYDKVVNGLKNNPTGIQNALSSLLGSPTTSTGNAGMAASAPSIGGSAQALPTTGLLSLQASPYKNIFGLGSQAAGTYGNRS